MKKIKLNDYLKWRQRWANAFYSSRKDNCLRLGQAFINDFYETIKVNDCKLFYETKWCQADTFILKNYIEF